MHYQTDVLHREGALEVALAELDHARHVFDQQEVAQGVHGFFLFGRRNVDGLHVLDQFALLKPAFAV